jgi:hypothetical protein
MVPRDLGIAADFDELRGPHRVVTGILNFS